MQAVDILDRIDRRDHARLVDRVRQRELDEDSVDLVVGVQLRHDPEHLVLGGRLGQPHVAGPIPASVAALCLSRM